MTATICCVSNWSKEVDYQQGIKGPVMGPGAIGTAVWKGAKLSDVLWNCLPYD